MLLRHSDCGAGGGGRGLRTRVLLLSVSERDWLCVLLAVRTASQSDSGDRTSVSVETSIISS